MPEVRRVSEETQQPPTDPSHAHAAPGTPGVEFHNNFSEEVAGPSVEHTGLVTFPQIRLNECVHNVMLQYEGAI